MRILFPLVLLSLPLQSQTLTSPNGRVVAEIAESGGRLTWALRLDDVAVIEPSALGFTLNGRDFGEGVEVGTPEWESVEESFPSRQGVHAMVTNHYQSGRWPVTLSATGEAWFLQFRVFDHGVAFRYEMVGEGAKNFTAESTTYTFPAGAQLRAQGGVDVYENVYDGLDGEALLVGTRMGPPVVGKLASGVSFALTHAGPGVGFPNPYLEVAENRKLKTVYVRNGDGTTGASTGGDLSSPWNVVTVGSLDDLVNADLVEALAPAPDPELFPEGTATSWAQPGRSVWDWMSRFPGGITAENSKLESLWASRLGFEYNTIDEGWGAWNGGDPWDQVKEVVEASEKVGVKVLVWVRSRDIRSRGQRAAFFSHLKEAGVSGFKADFFDFGGVSPAAKERVRLAERILREAAHYQLVANFHGFGKPLGQFRSYPNLLNIEAVFGKESFPNAETTVQIPLTRLLAGPTDYTPLGLEGRLQGDQTQAFEIATMATMAGPLITLAERGDRMAQSPFASVIAGIPCLWDETRVLEGTEVGSTCAMARRVGEVWYVAILNAGPERSWQVALDFLDPGREYQGEIVRDGATTLEQRLVSSGDAIEATTVAGGGLVVRLIPPGGEPVRSLPFETSFSTGRGSFFAERGQVLSNEPWAEPVLEDRLPDRRWAWSGTGAGGLTASLDEADAWHGGSSLKVEGGLTGEAELELFSCDLELPSDVHLELAFRGSGEGQASVALHFATGEVRLLPLSEGGEDWEVRRFDLTAEAGRRLMGIALHLNSQESSSHWSLRWGRLSLRAGEAPVPFAPSALMLENPILQGFDGVEGTLRWTEPPEGAAYYSIYQVSGLSGERRWLGVTEGGMFPVSVSRLDDEAEVIFQLAASSWDGVASGIREVRIALPPRPALGEALMGTVIGTTGSYDNSGATRERVFDGDTGSYFDAPVANDAWAGLDLGSGEVPVVRAIRFFPREGWAGRMTGGGFQGSNSASFSTSTTLATISVEPKEGQWTLLPVEGATAFRYLRYRSPNGGWGNVAEVSFHPAGTLVAPSGVEAGRAGSSARVEWRPLATAASYRIGRAEVSGGPYELAGETAEGAYFFDDDLDPMARVFYVVTAVSVEGFEGPPSLEVEALDPFVDWLGAPGEFEQDANGDGRADGLEFALGGPLQCDFFGEMGNRIEVLLRDDRMLDARLFRSPDLSQWQEVGNGPVVTQDGLPTGFVRTIFEDFAAGDAAAYYRLRLNR
ncbi:hypothetical protein HNR46_000462 [Haloferula luteola]|uniref:Alpha-glucosidase n=1 Tax=Haloferula luteola TaxID=595692 RepID=A0A840V626_9BACT|nr:glycoside hydrolase family 97 catalytic domain-containing protein [Haloferula luteola]MBB5350238.1 hypothetical protein [Haloferula luteola]